MKKLLITSFSLILLGAGCASTQTDISPQLDQFSIVTNMQGIPSQDFYNGDSCIYMHGKDSSLIDWSDASEQKLGHLLDLLIELPFVKVDYSDNSVAMSDKIFIGPICNCTEFSRAEFLIELYSLHMPSRLIHGLENLESCFDYTIED
ncbi:MAG: hypothetical protein HOD87_05165 [Gammaproteobacteria bacterium]|jgi:hypothetical protein|nr:hypothetical protein [Gammaproteobacteria bacterium]